MVNKKEKLLQILAMIGIIGVAYRFTNTAIKSEKLITTKKKHGYHYDNTPTLLIHGSWGTAITYNQMINTFQKNNLAQKVLTVFINPWGKIKYYGQWDNHNINPLIQVIFQRNFDNGFETEAHWLANLLVDLNKKFNIQKYNIVAHSWGGSAAVLMMTRFGAIKNLPQLNKAILLATPVNEILGIHYQVSRDHIPDKQDNLYREMLKNKQNIPHNAIINNIYGTLSKKILTDGEVPISQAQSLAHIFQNQVKEYHEFRFNHVIHSDFHIKKNIINLIADLLWKNNIKIA